MEDLLLIPFADYWWAYVGFILALLAVLAFDLGVFSKPGTIPSLKSAAIRSVIFIALALAFNYGLYQFLLQSASVGRRTVLVIDEAHRLPIETLEVIRLLNNLETERDKLLQIILVGQPELQDTLEREEIRQLTQRISLHSSLKSLSLPETDAYISHRLECGGQSPLVRFDLDAVKWVWTQSKGTPRKINQLCEALLRQAEGERTHLIDERQCRLLGKSLTSTDARKPRSFRDYLTRSRLGL
ncbi:hypothetical protein EBZ37_11605 [bacterium]|nr:hypothetical protein [bacterium]